MFKITVKCVVCGKPFLSRYQNSKFCNITCRRKHEKSRRIDNTPSTWLSLRWDVLSRDKFTCQYCGRKAPEVILNVDHIIPVSKGGKNKMCNLKTACFECNNGKSDKLL